MRNKIARKLTLYFTIALLVFSIIIGSIFIVLFREHTININKSELQERAASIANTITGYLDNEISSPKEMMQFEGYISNLSNIAMSDVWIVDQNSNIITRGPGLRRNFTVKDLPKNAEVVIKEAFLGNPSFSESFSSILESNTLTVGVPINKSDGKTIGVVLLHSSISGTNDAIKQGILILIISLTIALIISILLAIGFSITFTKPLNKMKEIALQLADGKYSIKTGINQKDEIGELALAIDRLSIRLDDADKQSEKLEQIRRDYVANISHELKTPITVIRGSLEALCDGIITEPKQINLYYNQMLIETKGLQRLVSDLLDLSRLQNIDFKIDMIKINLCDIINDVERSAKKLAVTKGVEIATNIPQAPYVIYGDYGRIRQLLMIILDNAIKFSPRNAKVDIKLVEKEEFILSISDKGKGISKEEIPYIFDRFYKTKSIENENGTGLGLAIAKEIVFRHNVNLTVSSDATKGTVFTLAFKKQVSQ